MNAGVTPVMADESAKRAAEEYLATKLSEEGQEHEARLNHEAALTLAPSVWRHVSHTLLGKCREWNAITGEQTLTFKETVMGDLRVWCAGKSHSLTIHYDSRRRLVTIKNSARPTHEPDLILTIEGYLSDSGRAARLVRNNEPANLDALLVAQLRIISGLDRQAKV
jgi:hypothetical protein